jgi:signal transduction histidine kinase
MCVLTPDEIHNNQNKNKISCYGVLEIINQTVKAFSETNNLTEILKIILLGVTSGQSFGFNRGFILLADDRQKILHGCLATGPSTVEEAEEIWGGFQDSSMPLYDVLRLYKIGQSEADIEINRLVASITLPVESQNFITASFMSRIPGVFRKGVIDNESDHEIFSKIGSREMAVVPLHSGNINQGILIADNLITSDSISENDLKFLEIFARYASDAIANTNLYGKLQRKITRLKEANEQILRTRGNLIRAEKLSTVSKMALEVAHEIRNPLTVIGGNANFRLSKLPSGDFCKPTLETISHQVSRIESVLDRFSDIISLSRKKDQNYKLYELINETLDMLCHDYKSEKPKLNCGEEIKKAEIFIDKGLFHQALLSIFREIFKPRKRGINVELNLTSGERSNMLMITGADKFNDSADNYKRWNEIFTNGGSAADLAVAFEIIEYYRGKIEFTVFEGRGKMTIKFPKSGGENEKDIDR